VSLTFFQRRAFSAILGRDNPSLIAEKFKRILKMKNELLKLLDLI
jgi:hypothetical protein